MNVSACIVTRGDVDLTPILDSLPPAWERIVWDNSKEERDIAVYGRYEAAFERATHPIVYVQDDDCVLGPEAFVELRAAWRSVERFTRDALVANMPARFRHDFYVEHCLVGFGALFERRLARGAFEHFGRYLALNGKRRLDSSPWFNRVCDVIFTTLTQRVLVDVPHSDLPWASLPDRMWKQPSHVVERKLALDLALKARWA